MSNNRRGSVSFLTPPVPPRNSITEEPEIKGIRSIKDDLTTIHDELNKLKASKCKCRCSEVETRLLKQIDNLSKSIKELVEN